MITKTCEHCGADYDPRQRNQRFCSFIYANAWHADERRRGIDLLRSSTYYGRELFAAAEAEDSPIAAVGACALRGRLPAPDWSRQAVGQEPFIDGTGESDVLGVALGGSGR